MSQVLQTYLSLTQSSPRSAVSSTLQPVADGHLVDQDSAKSFTQALLDDLKACIIDATPSRLCADDAHVALLAIKTLGKNPSTSELLSTPANLSTLLALHKALQDSSDASHEALRCVANTLLLTEQARTTWVSKDIGGGDAILDLLERSVIPEQIFLASRILFLCTASFYSSGPFIQHLVEDRRPGGNGTAIDIIGTKIDVLTGCILTGTKLSREATSDLLKFVFNLLVHYPKMVDCEAQGSVSSSEAENRKVMGDFWSHHLDGVLPPLLRCFHLLPPTSPSPLTTPLTHVIHALITIPISPTLRPIWLSGTLTNVSSPSTPDVSKDVKISPIDRAWSSVLAVGRRSLSRSSSPRPGPSRSASPTVSSPSGSSPPLFDTAFRAYDLLEICLNHYLPGNADPDLNSVREIYKKEGESSLDEILTPLALLITRLCIANEEMRRRIRERLVPLDLDRTLSLEGRADTLGRCLRLLGSVHHVRLKDAIGEMLFAMCNSDATLLCACFGYGNVAGFLFHKGVMNAPPVDASSNLAVTSSSAPLNPITGTVQTEAAPVQMTEEEKEVEAERLFVLFDRLERSGVLPARQNPIRQAIQRGSSG